MNDHDRPTKKQIANSSVMAAAGVGGAARYLREKQRFRRIEAWQMWCIVAAALGSASGVAFAGAMMSTKQTLACMRAEKAHLGAEGSAMDLEFSMRREQDRKDNEEATHHLQAIRMCHQEGNVPVLGFDYAVVCISKPTISWQYSHREEAPTWL